MPLVTSSYLFSIGDFVRFFREMPRFHQGGRFYHVLTNLGETLQDKDVDELSGTVFISLAGLLHVMKDPSETLADEGVDE